MPSDRPHYPLNVPGDYFFEVTARGQSEAGVIFPTSSINAGLILCSEQNAFVSVPKSPFVSDLGSPPAIEMVVQALQLTDEEWAPIDEWLFRGFRLGAIRASRDTAKISLRGSIQAAYERYTILRRDRPSEFLPGAENQ